MSPGLQRSPGEPRAAGLDDQPLVVFLGVKVEMRNSRIDASTLTLGTWNTWGMTHERAAYAASLGVDVLALTELHDAPHAAAILQERWPSATVVASDKGVL